MKGPFKLSPKQKEYWKNANKAFNIKTGATRSGKTWLDYYMIPRRIRNTTGDGAIVLLGNTRGTLQRNIIEPMQREWGPQFVSDISSNNTVRMFGRTVHALGADKANMQERLRGMSIEYAYGDEIATWSPVVFEQLKARLDLPNSTFDGTCNPEGSKHWFKKDFLDDPEMRKYTFHQHYELDDNIFLPKDVKERLKASFRSNPILWDRYILGLWVDAEGLVYPKFAGDRAAYFIKSTDVPELSHITVGVDFGGNASKDAFVASGISKDYSHLYALSAKSFDKNMDANELGYELIKFVKNVEDKYGMYVSRIYADNAIPTLIRTLKSSFSGSGLNRVIRGARKFEVRDRIEATVSLIGLNRFHYTEDAEVLAEALSDAVWEKDSDMKRQEDWSTDVLDAFEYSFENDMKHLIDRLYVQ